MSSAPEAVREMQGRRSWWNAAVAVLCLLLIAPGCDGGQSKKKAEAAATRGVEELNARNPQAAKEYFDLALKWNPYQPVANLGMARLCDQYRFESAAAQTYYRRYLDLADSEEKKNTALQELQALEAVSSGRVENPAFAAEDLLGAAQGGRRVDFFERVGNEYLHSMALQGIAPEPVMAQLAEFCRPGKPEIVFRKIGATQQTAIVVLYSKDLKDSSPYLQLAFMRGSGELRNLWLLAGVQSLAVPTRG